MEPADGADQVGTSRGADPGGGRADWHWQPGTAAQEPTGPLPGPLEATGVATRFPTQAEAEAWLAETWTELLDAGLGEVSLYQGGRRVYGPMSLHQQ